MRFCTEDYRGNAWRMIRGTQSYNVVIRFEAGMADTVSDVRWHQTQEIDYHADGSITFRCRVDGLDEIQYWVLSYGAGAQVIEPSELAERIASMAKATAERYAQPGHPKARADRRPAAPSHAGRSAARRPPP